MESRWMLYTKRADFQKISARFLISPVTARVMVNRDIQEKDMEKYLHAKLEDLHDTKKLKDGDRAVEIIARAIEQKKKIRVVGDYDIDGVCASYILVTGLHRIGAQVDCDIPDRIKDGYGINAQIIEKAAADGIALIITCDNGIAAFEAMEYAHQMGIDVIITDYHEVFKEEGKDRLPLAKAIINPKQADCHYPFDGICGAVVAWKLVELFYCFFDVSYEEWKLLLSVAAIATVGDVMQLKDENRIIVRYGLRALEKTKNLGLRALLQVCELENKELTAYHIGFIIGPCLNASGRLKTAKLALELLMSKDMETAKQRAMELKRLNDERKDMTQQGVDQAIEIVEAAPEEKVLVVYLSDCHESLAGIIAGRLRERYQRPAIVLTDAQEEGMLKGSGRSIGAYPMFEKLCEADGFLEKYGGHPMAAGLSLKKENVEAFRRFLNEHSKLVESDFVKEVWIDVAMPFGYISEDLVAQLAQLAPFGQGNESPTFAQKDVEILNARVLGKDHNVVRLSLKDSAGTRMEGLVFTDGDAFIEEAKRFIDIIYAPQVNEYMGQRTLQVVIRDWKFKSK